MYPKVIRLLALLSVVLALAGCGDRMELHRDLTEQDANEIMAELADKNISAYKRLDKSSVSVLVAAQDISRAVRALEAVGLPRRSRSSLGEVFRKEGVISSPLEERARYIYALSQELEQTLSQIDGVVVARVHVVLPERIAPGEPVQPASAAVFIKHRDGMEPDSVLPRIRRMVASSIPGMAGADDKKLAVVFVPSQEYRQTVERVSLGPFELTRERLEFWQWILGLSAFGIALLLGGLFALNPRWLQRLSRRPEAAGATQGAER
ncbi:type III secretion inner membrane ring lipoprotein SctJ [Pseudomonas sp. 21LCFQ02]|uniref:type III secretion system inner membrane ring lipoprotein SctJ n=1 Tax=unclassified Pseudomonas TaxID=196821 RepID=UPI0004F5FC39|nr:MULTISPECIES: type III secretion inner membrane ring lipoprotein SctJ [unclassified Pseudomonas]MCO8161118.1 type III secretion inner membrane ring lipoprotein SctJ [Pseudomonas sp. 21LCFQ010]MCO8169089.1 type III secretion inner membrane ring lipoprotein SctJ [Pseudomonas sp. 21LCFQ02]MCQ9422094.1 type III secretion inner membrane ring lipoprotein SctJ [Pseudomonas sp. LJDD11]BAP46084.1 type III secretion component protein HrcJ [Pseudomonas sp. StFLB209]